MTINSHKQVREHTAGDVFNALEMHALNGAARLVRLMITTFAHTNANREGVFKQLTCFRSAQIDAENDSLI